MPRPPRHRAVQAIGLALALSCLTGPGDSLSYAAKAKAPARSPDLKILSVDPMPFPFVVNEPPWTLTIMVELPKNLPEQAMLNVTTLITSPSKSSIRLLENNQPLTDKTLADAGTKDGDRRQVKIVQKWDGTDQTKQLVSDGIYDYQVQAKLMVAGKNGPVTRETAWKKRGTFEVRTR
jgi:hypothetical protein